MSKQKDSALNLAKFIDKNIMLKLAGGREGIPIAELVVAYKSFEVNEHTADRPLDIFRAVVGVLKGYDQLLNVVLDDASEYMRGKPIFCVHHCQPMSLGIQHHFLRLQTPLPCAGAYSGHSLQPMYRL
jgi:small nuclear ribonucleoprotein (snRNP)-like protein